jgi:uncharacterized C2H2 Zn-finger protein
MIVPASPGSGSVSSDDGHGEGFDDNSWEPDTEVEEAVKSVVRVRHADSEEEDTSQILTLDTYPWPHNGSKKRILCPDCGVIIKSLQETTKHMRENHPKSRPYPCAREGCAKMFRSPVLARNHENKSHRDVLYKCLKCDAIFRTKTYVTEHMEKAHSEAGQIFECSKCQRKYPTEKQLRHHGIYSKTCGSNPQIRDRSRAGTGAKRLNKKKKPPPEPEDLGFEYEVVKLLGQETKG